MTRSLTLLALLALPLSSCALVDADLAAGAIPTLEASATTDALGLRQTVVSGTFTLGYTADQDVSLRILDNAAEVFQGTFAADALSISFEQQVELPFVGPNVLTVEASYNGQTKAVTLDLLTIEPTAPVLTLPTWATSYSPGQSMTISGDLGVAPAPDSTVLGVLFSADGGATWLQALDNLDGTWAIDVVNPDVGEQFVTYRVDTDQVGMPLTTMAESSFPVSPVFNCNDSNNMLPTEDMIQDLRYETRTLLGYFGDSANHTVTVSISFRDENGDDFEVVGALLHQTPTSVQVEFHVDRARCGGNCPVDYDLSFRFDGSTLCNSNNYGRIWEY